jgi:hypothetical protein
MMGGPGHLRFFIQPALAALLGVRDGVRDARHGRLPFLIALVTERRHRRRRLLEALRTLALAFSIAFVVDVIFQHIIHERVRLGAAVGYVEIFVALPYLIVRGLSNRIYRALSPTMGGATPRPAP